MTGFFAYSEISAQLTPSDSTTYSPPYQGFRCDAATAQTANLTLVDGTEVTLTNIQPGTIVPIKFKKMRVGSGTFQGLRWNP